MDDLRALIAGDQPVAPSAPVKSAPNKVKDPTAQEMYGVKDLQDSLTQIQSTLPDLVPGSPSHKRALADIQSIQSELQRHTAAAPQTTQQAASGDPLRDMIAGTPPVDTSVVGAATPQGHLTPQQIEAQVKQPQPFLGRMKPTGPNPVAEALTTMATGLGSTLLGGGLGIVSNITSPQFGTPEGQKNAEDIVRQTQAGLTYQPKTPQGQSYIQKLQDAFEASKLPPIIPEAAGFAPLAGPATSRFKLESNNMAGRIKTATNDLIGQATTVANDLSGKARTVASDLIGQATSPYKTAKPGPVDMAAMQQQFASKQPTLASAETNLGSVGAAAANPADVIKTNINAALTNASPELNQLVQSKDPASINLPALETKALEEKHGINLTTSQRLGDTQGYAREWNRRGETTELSNHFEQQPKQVADAFDALKEQHAPDINPLADASELGQHEINALADKDEIRQSGISNAYKQLVDANGGQFPIDIQTLSKNVDDALSQNLKKNHLSSAIASDLQDFYKDPTFEKYEALRTNTATEMRSNSNGNARGAAYIVRQELEKLPVFGEENAEFDPHAAQLKQLADNARSLVTERSNVIKYNPAYRKAIGEAADINSAVSEGESLNAAKFHNQFVSNATPEAIRRMKAEIAPDDIAHQAITFGELNRAKNAAISAKNDLTPASLATFLQKNKSSLNQSLTPEAMQGVSEIGSLASKIGQPKTGVFNYSNTYSSMLGDMTKQGLTSAAEAKLAASTGGASIPVVSLVRQFAQKRSKDAFAKQAIDPFGGITKD